MVTFYKIEKRVTTELIFRNIHVSERMVEYCGIIVTTTISILSQVRALPNTYFKSVCECLTMSLPFSDDHHQKSFSVAIQGGRSRLYRPFTAVRQGHQRIQQ